MFLHETCVDVACDTRSNILHWFDLGWPSWVRYSSMNLWKVLICQTEFPCCVFNLCQFFRQTGPHYRGIRRGWCWGAWGLIWSQKIKWKKMWTRWTLWTLWTFLKWLHCPDAAIQRYSASFSKLVVPSSGFFMPPVSSVCKYHLHINGPQIDLCSDPAPVLWNLP